MSPKGFWAKMVFPVSVEIKFSKQSRFSRCNSGAIGMKQGGNTRDNRQYSPYIWDCMDTVPPYMGNGFVEDRLLISRFPQEDFLRSQGFPNWLSG